MSGDVQPRKRKDKKRKKDDGSEHITTHIQPSLITTNLNEEQQNIHVHKDEGTGGGICAKIVFFLLFTALAVCIGLIITEHRGLTDLEATTESESRFSQIFEGWIDKSPSHDDDDDHLEHSLDDYDDDHGIGDDSNEIHDEHDEDDDEDEEEESQPDDDMDEAEDDEDEIKSEEDEDDEENDNRSEAQDEDEDDNDDDNEEDEEEEENVDVSEEKDEIDDDDGDQSPEEEQEEEEEEEANISQQVEDDDDDDDNNEVDEVGEDEEPRKYATGSEENIDKEADEVDADKNQENSKSVNVRPDDNEAEESDSDKQSDDDYEYENVTNKDDWKIKEQIDEAQKTTNNNAAYAVKLFDVLLETHPSSPRCYYGKAQALDRLAEQKRSNTFLQQAIDAYLKLLNLNNVPDVLFENAAERCINRMRFVGDYSRAINVHSMLIKRFPDVAKYRNQLAVSYLTMNRPNKARIVLSETLSKYPNDGVALVHYGFILKTADNDLNKSVDYMRRGLATKDPDVIDGRFYFHLGDALTRLGHIDEAMKVYEEGVENNLFLSKYQRSLYNVDRLTGKPWWHKSETPQYQNLYHQLESNWQMIRNEGLSVLSKSGYFQNESENLKDTGDWKQFELFARGQKNIENCKKCPATCRIIETVTDARGCRRGQTKFSVMHPGTHVWPHCGPTNCRLRVHLGLSVPPKTYIRVADEIRSWENGQVLIFDDSFEHEVWHNGTQFRLVLIVDVWHPELTTTEKRTLSPI